MVVLERGRRDLNLLLLEGAVQIRSMGISVVWLGGSEYQGLNHKLHKQDDSTLSVKKGRQGHVVAPCSSSHFTKDMLRD